jgi:GT2 family glycosyltransferase
MGEVDLPYSPLAIVVVINWNNPGDTLVCIESLNNLDYSNYHVLILDNGSDDDSLDILTEVTLNLPRFTVIETGDNLGFSGGVNFGIVEAQKKQADYIWLLNNDAEVAPDCLSKLLETMEQDSDIAIAGSKILLSNQRDIVWHAGATFDEMTGQPKHLGMGVNIHNPDYSINQAVDYVTGSSLIIREKAISTIGIMDDRFYLYYEEADLCYRARKHGFKIVYVAESILWHKVAASSTGYHMRVYYEVRNRLLFTIKHKPSQFLSVLSYLIVQELIKHVKDRNFKVVKYASLGLLHFFTARFGRLRYIS